MKIDTDDLGVFKVTIPMADVNDWLLGPSGDLVEVNGAIDEAASWVNETHDKGYVVIEIVHPTDKSGLTRG
jgi:hypothetical protein